MAGNGQKIIAGTEKALELLRDLPRISLSNIRSNPKAFPKVTTHYIAESRPLMFSLQLRRNVEEDSMEVISTVQETKVLASVRTS